MGDCGWVEVVKELGDEHQIEARLELDLKRATRQAMPATRDACRSRIFLSDVEHPVPILRKDFGVWVGASQL
jgi:hypothetical protein